MYWILCIKINSGAKQFENWSPYYRCRSKKAMEVTRHQLYLKLNLLCLCSSAACVSMKLYTLSMLTFMTVSELSTIWYLVYNPKIRIIIRFDGTDFIVLKIKCLKQKLYCYFTQNNFTSSRAQTAWHQPLLYQHDSLAIWLLAFQKRVARVAMLTWDFWQLWDFAFL